MIFQVLSGEWSDLELEVTMGLIFPLIASMYIKDVPREKGDPNDM
jgi:hypothetical protein